MMDILIIAGVGAVPVALVLTMVFVRKRPRSLKTERFHNKWREMQKLLGDKTGWKQAIIDADKLLDEALRRRRFGGKTMGERLTKAQHVLSDNEAVWFGHKLRNKIEGDSSIKLKEAEVKQALIGIRQALKDLGALPDGK
ncbi:MAG TPA: hypothetical protein VF809_00875 [Candidatus Saccharimonadales bacterium]